MIIRRKPGKTLFWGTDLDPQNLGQTCDGYLLTHRYKRGDDAKAIVSDPNSSGAYAVEVGEKLDFGAVVMTLVAIDERGAHWDIQAPREVRILRDDTIKT